MNKVGFSSFTSSSNRLALQTRNWFERWLSLSLSLTHTDHHLQQRAQIKTKRTLILLGSKLNHARMYYTTQITHIIALPTPRASFKSIDLAVRKQSSNQLARLHSKASHQMPCLLSLNIRCGGANDDKPNLVELDVAVSISVFRACEEVVFCVSPSSASCQFGPKEQILATFSFV